MSLISSFGKWVCALLLFFSLASTVFIFSLAQLTEHDSMEPFFIGILSQTITSKINETELSMMYNILLSECTRTGAETVDFPGDGENITLSCSEIEKSTSQELIGLVAGTYFSRMYYKEYGCAFTVCIKEEKNIPMVFFTSLGHSFFQRTYKYPAIAAVILIAALLLFKPWYDSLRKIGMPFFILGLPFFFFPFIVNFLQIKMPEEAAIFMIPLLTSLIRSLSNKLLIMFIVGVVLIVAGFVFGFLARKKKKKKREIKKVKKARKK